MLDATTEPNKVEVEVLQVGMLKAPCNCQHMI